LLAYVTALQVCCLQLTIAHIDLTVISQLNSLRESPT